jgi:putative oxidoreductase
MPRLAGITAFLPTLAAIAAGVVFVSFGVGHFARHAAEVGDFHRYQVPFPGLAVWAVGVVESSAGVALMLGLLVRPAAAALATDMVGVVATAGRVEGGWLNLGVAPLLLAMMVFLLWAGPGAVSLDAALYRRTRAANCGGASSQTVEWKEQLSERLPSDGHPAERDRAGPTSHPGVVRRGYGS